MEVKVSMVIMSHLSDVQEGMFDHKEMRKRINFIKFLLLKYSNTDVMIYPKEEFIEFMRKHEHS